MKKMISILLASLMILTLAACGGTTPSTPSGSSNPSTPSTPSAPSSKTPTTNIATCTPGVLTVGTSPDWPPFEFIIMENGQEKIVGFEMEIAQYIADEMGLELKIVPMAFEAVLIELGLGSIDLGISGFNSDPDRKCLFSDPYYTGTQCLVVKKADLGKYTGVEDFNKAGLAVGAQTASIQLKLAAKLTPNAEQVLLETIPTLIMELKSDKIQALYLESVVAEGFMMTQDDLAILCEVPFDTNGVSITIEEGNTELLTVINGYVAKMLAEGKVDEWTDAAKLLAVQMGAY